MEQNIKYMLTQLDKQKTERDKQLVLFNWIRCGTITFEEYQELVKYLFIPVVLDSKNEKGQPKPKSKYRYESTNEKGKDIYGEIISESKDKANNILLNWGYTNIVFIV